MDSIGECTASVCVCVWWVKDENGMSTELFFFFMSNSFWKLAFQLCVKEVKYNTTKNVQIAIWHSLEVSTHSIACICTHDNYGIIVGPMKGLKDREVFH